MTRSFEVRTYKQGLVCNLARELDEKLTTLQQEGWEIVSVVNTPCKEWEANKGYFDSVLFTIIAKHK
jgi:hypothetical protein